jgi:hypothetical protein
MKLARNGISLGLEAAVCLQRITPFSTGVIVNEAPITASLHGIKHFDTLYCQGCDEIMMQVRIY